MKGQAIVRGRLLMCGLAGGVSLCVALLWANPSAPAVQAEPVANPFDGRKAQKRAQLLKDGGVTAKTEAAVAAGLVWLTQHQAVDGHWAVDTFHLDGKCNCGDLGAKHDMAGTAFGLLPLLGAGHAHRGLPLSPYAKNVDRGIKFLLQKQGKDGRLGAGMYEHGLATMALCEAYGMTADPALKASAQKAIDYIVEGQNATGGWDYGKGGVTADTSVGGWQVQALRAGKLAGLKVPKETLDKMDQWLTAYQGDAVGATYGYRSAGSSANLSSVGVLSREFLGWGPDNKGLQAGIKQLMRRPPTATDRRLYYYYYATQAVHNVGGENWETWNTKMIDLFVTAQDPGTDPAKKHQKGSWSSAGWDIGGYGGGRLMMTSLALLTLEVYYRYAPLSRPKE